MVERSGGKRSDTAFDLFLLRCFAGHERSVDELAALAAECGLEFRGSSPVTDERTAMEFVPR